MASFDKDGELDPELAGISLSALHSRYVQQFEGYTLCELMKKHTQDDGDPKLAPKLEKALDGVMAEVKALVDALPSEGAEEVPGEVGKGELLLEMYWRIHDAWKSNPEVVGGLKLIAHDERSPKWKDLEALFGELLAVDHDGGDGDSFPTRWYEALLNRLDAKPGRVKKKAAAKVSHEITTPPPNATIHDYSPKSTYSVGQWLRHPKFGVGRVAEVATHVTCEFGADRKVLTHTPAVIVPPNVPPSKARSTSVNTLEMARAAGIEIKKIPGIVPEE